jgi:hypothetical protein
MLGQMLSAGCRGLNALRALPCCRCLRYSARHGLRESYQPAPIYPAQNADTIQARSLDDPQLQKFIVAATGGDGQRDRSSRSPAQPSWDVTRLTLAGAGRHHTAQLDPDDRALRTSDRRREETVGGRNGDTGSRGAPHADLDDLAVTALGVLPLAIGMSEPGREIEGLW